jgi:UDP:flavonoid glycosyltransferase YjiC (YdhE family)
VRFLFCSFSSPGFLFPLIGLAAELEQRGHAVAFVSGPLAGDVLGLAGLRRIPRGDRDGPSFNVSTWYMPISVAIDVKHIEYAIATEHPDVLVTHHLCLSALIVRDRQTMPAAVLGPMAYLYPPARATLPAISTECARRLQWRLDEGTKVLNDARQLFHLRPVTATSEGNALLGDLFMLRTAPFLESNLDALPSRVHAVGPCTWEPRGGGGEGGDVEAWQSLLAAFADPDAPVVYVHNGRTFDGPSFWPQLVSGLGSAPIQVVASVARMDTEVGVLPKNFLVRPHVSQDLVLSHAKAVIASGHSSVAIGAAVHGVPSVLIPIGVETPENTDRLVAAGCAIALDIETLTPATIGEAVDRLLRDGTVQRNCLGLRERLRAMNTFASAARLVEIMARTRGPVGRDEAVSLADALRSRPLSAPAV